MLTPEQYLDRVRAAWIGKNIGGTLGGPYEGKREYLNVEGFVTEPGSPLPNDDLDLQIVWLRAVERLGARGVNAQTLGEYWINYVPAHWNEYGIGMANMKAGFPAPVSGDYHNDWKDSNGAWIRTEIWACLAPASPALAAHYAIEDASVDHGVGEGTVAAAFVAAMESAAFVESDIRKLIATGLAAIPEESRMYDSIKLILSCYDKGMTSREARDAILERNADIGTGWFEAPSNVAYAVLGLLYGKGDFKKSMLEAINCGDDTDCTAATVGALLGIRGGTAAIPEDWSAYVGDGIVTTALNTALYYDLPKTCTALADRVVKQMPAFLISNNRFPYRTESGAFGVGAPADAATEGGCFFRELAYIRRELTGRRPYTAEYTFGPIRALVSTIGEPKLAAGKTLEVEIRLENRYVQYGNVPYGLRFMWHLPAGVHAVSADGNQLFLYHCSSHHPDTSVTYRATLSADEDATLPPIIRPCLEVEVEGRPTVGYLPINLAT